MERYTVPQIVWIDRQGNIRSQTPPPATIRRLYTEGYWRNMIETLLKEPATAPVRITPRRPRRTPSRQVK